jgi:hypothetical protein
VDLVPGAAQRVDDLRGPRRRSALGEDAGRAGVLPRLETLPPGFYNPALPKVLRVQPCWASFVRVDVDHANGRLVLLEGHASASNGWLALHMSWDLMA